nr:mRNA turnover protein 4 homolog [Tanacetum cinerariifolium]
MDCSLSHTLDEIKASVHKLIEEVNVRKQNIMELAMQFDSASTTKDDMRKTFKECIDIPQKKLASSKTKKKGRQHKEAIVNTIREAVEQYSSVYVFTFENMRNLKFKKFRELLKSTNRLFLGTNKVTQVALGRSDSY